MEGIKQNKRLLKVIIPVAAVLIIIFAGFIGYKVMKPTPEKTVQKYCDYLTNKEYDKAYKMLYNTDNDFMSEEMFEASLKSIDFKGYAIKDTNNKDYGLDVKQEEKSASYEVQVQGKTYYIEMLQNSNGLIFKDYKIDATKLADKWTFTVPEGTEVYINNKKIEKAGNTNNKSSYGKDKYDSKKIDISVDNIFKGHYDLTLKLDGAEDIIKEDVDSGEKIITDFKPKQELVDELDKKVKEFLNAYYKNSDLSNLVTSNNNLLSKKRSGDDVLSDINIKNIKLKGSNIASLDVTYTCQFSIWGTKYSEEKEKAINLEKENDKWVISFFDVN
ncbi:hypothetical protein NNC19_18900 [Clostridium sp. SHJSY1]|uniref:hypothetical protein n=1 Tax=Clostridium sp. SHJSY1 TaxID=2942483 RepID=UPI0028755F0B|nr:hypothetical protein [Clostridium sp. SHJSY1]MDS0527763.1 hypothetical protein [Clostridium sp. SHJSY1]